MGISEITGVEIPHEKGMYTKKMYLIILLLLDLDIVSTIVFLELLLSFFLKVFSILKYSYMIDLLTFTEESWLFGYERFSVWVNNYLDKSKFNIFIRFAVSPDNVHYNCLSQT